MMIFFAKVYISAERTKRNYQKKILISLSLLSAREMTFHSKKKWRLLNLLRYYKMCNFADDTQETCTHK